MTKSLTLLWDWLAISDTPEKSDIIFLFGGPLLEIPRKGLELYRQGFAPRIVATGHTGTFDDSGWGKPVADVFTKFLIQHGVDNDFVITQNRSMNTLEDVLFALSMFEDKAIPNHKAILVSRPIHQRRAYATYKRHAPDTLLINVPCDEPRPTDLSLSDQVVVGQRCLQEYERLIRYGEMGDLEKQEVPNSVRDAYEKLKAESLS
jgi:uncharacterized SAM-binding protein YcdF (DUF218 family)